MHQLPGFVPATFMTAHEGELASASLYSKAARVPSTSPWDSSLARRYVPGFG